MLINIALRMWSLLLVVFLVTTACAQPLSVVLFRVERSTNQSPLSISGGKSVVLRSLDSSSELTANNQRRIAHLRFVDRKEGQKNINYNGKCVLVFWKWVVHFPPLDLQQSFFIGLRAGVEKCGEDCECFSSHRCIFINVFVLQLSVLHI